MKTIVLLLLMITAFIFMSFQMSYGQTSRENPKINFECQNNFSGPTPHSHIRDHGPNANRDIPFEVQGLYPKIDRYATEGLCPKWGEDSNQKQNRKEGVYSEDGLKNPTREVCNKGIISRDPGPESAQFAVL